MRKKEQSSESALITNQEALVLPRRSLYKSVDPHSFVDHLAAFLLKQELRYQRLSPLSSPHAMLLSAITADAMPAELKELEALSQQVSEGKVQAVRVVPETPNVEVMSQCLVLDKSGQGPVWRGSLLDLPDTYKLKAHHQAQALVWRGFDFRNFILFHVHVSNQE